MSAKTYRIGEAAALLNLKTYVLRFWEVEFPQVAPPRTEKGQRLYTEKDLAVLRRIRYLLHERGLTIEGARRILIEEMRRPGPLEEQADPPFEQESEADPDGPVFGSAAPAQPVETSPSPLPGSLLRDLARELEDIRALLAR